MLDELERLHKAATPGEWKTHREYSPACLRTDDGRPVVDCSGTGRGRWQELANALFAEATFNALPALLRVARAALRYADLDGLPCDYAELDPDLEWQDRKASCPGIEKNGMPCHWCDLRAALAALTTTTAPPASE